MFYNGFKHIKKKIVINKERSTFQRQKSYILCFDTKVKFEFKYEIPNTYYLF